MSANKSQRILAVEQLEDRAVPTAAGYVGALYQTVLHRPADAGGLAYWSGMLDQGASPNQVAGAILDAPEARNQRTTTLFHSLLGRAPDAGALNYFGGLQAAGQPMD